MLVLTSSIFRLAYAPHHAGKARFSVNFASENYRIYTQVGEGQIRTPPCEWLSARSYEPLFRANPHLTLRARQPTTHVTPRFTSTSSILTSLLVHTPPPHLCSPVLPGMCLSVVALLSRASTPGEKDPGEPERALGGP
jgi:hypothetical protein